MGFKDVIKYSAQSAIDMLTQKGPFGVTFGIPGAETWKHAQLWQKGLDQPEGLNDPYANHAAVATGISIFCEDAAILPWDIYQTPDGQCASTTLIPEIGSELMPKHPLIALWNNPNEHMTGNQLWVGTYISYKVFGEAWWYYPDVVMPLPNQPSSVDRFTGKGTIDLLDPRSVIAKPSEKDSNKIDWFQRIDGVDHLLNSDRLTQFKRWNPYDPIRGLSELQALLAEIAGDQAAANWNVQFFGKQNGVPTGLLIPGVDGDSLGEPQEREILRRFNVRHGGRRGVGMLPAGWTWENIGIEHKKMDFKELRGYSREQIFGMIGVPPFRAGVLEGANFANAREQDRVYWNGAQRRFLTAMKGTIDNDFLKKLGINNTVCAHPRWDMIRQMLEDLKSKAETGLNLRNMGIPLTLINDKLNLGFDLSKVDGADDAFMPVNMAPVKLLLEGGMNVTEGSENIPGSQPTASEAQFRSQLEWMLGPLRKSFCSKWRSHLKSTRDNVARMIEGLEGFVALRGGSEIACRGGDASSSKARARVSGIYGEVIKMGGSWAFGANGNDSSFSLDNPIALSIKSAAMCRITILDQKLRRDISDGLAEATTKEGMLKALDDVIDSHMRVSSEISKQELEFVFDSTRRIVARGA